MTRLDKLPQFIAKDFEALIETYKQKVIEQYPGMQLIDFDNPIKYFHSLVSAEEEVNIIMAVDKLDDLFELIQQHFDEASQ